MIVTKYRAKKTEIDGIVFDSGKEARQYLIYKNLENDGEIKNLRTQVKYPFVYENKKMFTYIADFVYEDKENKTHVIDVKSNVTAKLPIFRLKKKLIEAQYGIEIEIVN